MQWAVFARYIEMSTELENVLEIFAHSCFENKLNLLEKWAELIDTEQATMKPRLNIFHDNYLPIHIMINNMFLLLAFYYPKSDEIQSIQNNINVWFYKTILLNVMSRIIESVIFHSANRLTNQFEEKKR